MPSLTINNTPIEVEAGTALLAAARGIGVEIPTLCYWEGVKPMNSCMLCVVHDATSGRLLPACSTIAQDGMAIETHSGDVCAARKEVLELIVSEHVGDCEAPCRHTCPASMDIPLMMRQVTQGDFEDAAATVSEGLVFPWTLGHVCPAPCENPCRRKQCDSPMQIREMHRTVAERAQDRDADLLHCAPDTGKHVAVIGGGLAGMAAAWTLRKLGHACTVYEKEDRAGGKLRGLPQEELPAPVLDAEIDRIARLGVAFEYGREMSGPGEIPDPCDAVVVACKSVAEPGGKVFEAPEHKLAVRAVGNGKTTGQWVHRYLNDLDPEAKSFRFQSRMGRLLKEELEILREHNENRKIFDPIEAADDEGPDPEEAARCLHCDCRKRVTCGLRKWAAEYGVETRKYKITHMQDFRMIGLGEVVFEPGKCIKCGLCVEIAKKHGEHLGLTFIGRGFDMEIRVPFNGSLDEGLTKSADECVAACPTAALSFRNREDIGYDVHTGHGSLNQ